MREVAAAHSDARVLPLPRPPHRPAGLPRGGAEAEGDLLHPDRRLRGGRDEARPDRPARRVDAGRLRRDREPGPRQGALQRRRGARPRRRRRSRSPPRAASGSPRSPTRRSRSPAPTGSCSRSSRSCRCSCSPTTSPAPAASTSTSRATSPRPSPSSSAAIGCRAHEGSSRPRGAALGALPSLRSRAAAAARPARTSPAWRRRDRCSTSKATVRPRGELKANVDAVAKRLGGIDDLGDFVVDELENSANGDGEPLDFERTSSRGWASRAASSSRRYDGERLHRPRARSSKRPTRRDAGIHRHAGQGERSPDKEARLRRRRIQSRPRRRQRVGIVGDYVVFGEDERAFKAGGRRLRRENRWPTKTGSARRSTAAPTGASPTSTWTSAPWSSTPAARSTRRPASCSQSAGIDPSEATAVASVIPGADQIEIELSSDLGGEKPPRGDASELLGSLPAGPSPPSRSPASATS